MDDKTIERLRALTNFPAIFGFLSRDLDWPIEVDDFSEEDLSFSYTAEELGINERYSAAITRIRQLRNLVDGQPWGIFYVEFENKRLPVTVLRRILSRLGQATPDRPGWQMEDLLFICIQGPPGQRGVAFAHFRRTDAKLPELRTFSWDSRENHFYYLRNFSLERLRWPADEDDRQAWRTQWRSAFTSPHYVIHDDKKLASIMAAQAREMWEIIDDLYTIESRDGGLHRLFERFRKGLLHDLTPNTFADVVAQTITYGLFAAAAQQANISFADVVNAIPRTNPFLRDLLQSLVDDDGIDLGELGVDRLVEIFNEANVPDIARRFMRQTGSGREDPVIHFYELFLAEYDRWQKVERGVFYTPNPVVSYIVRAVDAILQDKFAIPDGLASAEKVVNPTSGQLEHRVQVLDPATGTGTFLQYIIEAIAAKKNPRNEPNPTWERYVAEELLPRLNGFELMMAPYTVAHMKLGLKLHQTGYRFEQDSRLRVFLNNTLDKPVRMQEVLLEADYLSREANEAAVVKLSRPIMVIIGNPPYSGHSANQMSDDWIGLRDEYYTVDGKPLGERNPKWLQDDYVKFIRFGQQKIEQTGAGILAFITNHGYLNNPTFRGMRESLLQTFDEIYILDLHGNAKKRETAPDGTKDENVFDIMQGVAIGIFVKNGSGSDGLAKLVHRDLYGYRDVKYQFLLTESFSEGNFSQAETQQPYYLFIPQDMYLLAEYQRGWKLADIYPVFSAGLVTARDSLTIHWSSNEVEKVVRDFVSLSPEQARYKYHLGKDTRDWKVSLAQTDVRTNSILENHIVPVLYRPFDMRHTYYTGQSRGFMCMPRAEVMRHFVKKNNLGLISARSNKSSNMDHFLITRSISEAKTGESTTQSSLFPVYLYPRKNELLHRGIYPISDEYGRYPNINPEFIGEVEALLRMQFIAEGQGDLVNTFGPEDIIHYTYAIFHSPTYRQRYAEFLKIDFPHLPLTNDILLFNSLAQLGADLVALHLHEDDYAAASWNLNGEESPLSHPGVTFHEGADGRAVGKFSQGNYHKGRVYLDSSKKEGISYFEGVEADVWNFQIGGYQVMHKWLYDRRGKGKEPGRVLTDEDIRHYPRIAAALRETIRLMAEIDNAIEQHGGWPLRGSQPDDEPADPELQTRLIDQLKERNEMSNSHPTLLSFIDPDDGRLPDELTRDMLEAGLERASGLEAEIDDPSLEDGMEITPFDPAKINIETRPMTVGQFMNRIRDFEESNGEEGINLRPDFQRMGGIWNDAAQSRLIESMMIRIPLPAFYMNEDEEKGDLWVVIDGLQRLTAMRRFIIDRTLKLRRLEFWKEYENKTFDELPRLLQRRLEETQVVVYLVKKGTPHNVKFNIFKRINTGGVPLSGQEIRHALNLGAATDLLKELANTEAFRAATDNGVSHLRMADRECVLRYIAFMSKSDPLRELPYQMRDYTDYTGRDDLDTFLNDQMKQLNAIGRQEPALLRYLSERFERTMHIAREIFDNRAFRKPTTTGRRSPVSKALFEVWAVNLDRFTDEQVGTLIRKRKTLEKKFRQLMNDTEFVIAISYSTGDARRVKYRFEKIRQIIEETLADV